MRTLDSLEWLVSDAAVPWLELASQSSQTDVQLAATLRKSLSAEQACLVLQQVDLRRRAKAKFADAERMFFTPVGFEQATDEITARYIASRFPTRGPIFDLCCGIGGNLIALSERAQAIGAERDPATAIFAQANLAIATQTLRSNVIVADVESFTPSDVAAWHIDPDRRPQGKRTTQVALHQPGPEVIERWWKICPHAAIKLAPAAVLPDDWPGELQLEWISRARECRQLVVWSGELATLAGRRCATVLGSGSDAPRTVVGDPSANVEVAAAIGSYIFEPDAAVLAAGLHNALAIEHDLQLLQPGVAYFTGDKPVSDPALACFAVADVLSLDIRELKSYIQSRLIGQLEIKKRGIDLDPEKFRRQLKPSGPNAATLLIFPQAGKPRVVVAKRIT